MLILLLPKYFQIPVYTINDFIECIKTSQNIELQNNISLHELNGSETYNFTGRFEGNNFMVSDYISNKPLFSQCLDCILSNIIFSNFIINSNGHSSIFNKTTSIYLHNITIVYSQFLSSKSASTISYWSSSIFQVSNLTIYNVNIKAPKEGGLFIYNIDNVQITKSTIHILMSKGPSIGLVAPSLNINLSDINVDIISSNQSSQAYALLEKNQNAINISTSTVQLYCDKCQSIIMSSGELNKSPSSYINNSLLQILDAQKGNVNGQNLILQGFNIISTAIILSPNVTQFQLYNIVTQQNCSPTINEFKCSYIYGRNSSEMIKNFSNVTNCPISNSTVNITNILMNTSNNCNYKSTYLKMYEYATPMSEALLSRFKSKQSDIIQANQFQESSFGDCVTINECGEQCGQFYQPPFCYCSYLYNNTTKSCTNINNTPAGNCSYQTPYIQTCTSCGENYQLRQEDLNCYPKNCSSSCDCTNLSIINDQYQFTCSCPSGYDWNKQCTECSYGYKMVNGYCAKSLSNLNGNCTIINGTVNCICNAGYGLDNGLCREIYNDDSITLIFFAVLFILLAIAVIVFFAIQFVRLSRRDKYLIYNPNTQVSDAPWQLHNNAIRPPNFVDVNAQIEKGAKKGFQV